MTRADFKNGDRVLNRATGEIGEVRQLFDHGYPTHTYKIPVWVGSYLRTWRCDVCEVIATGDNRTKS